MSDKMIIDVQDISVPIARAINIAIINQPNPVSGFEATAASELVSVEFSTISDT